LYLIPTTLDDDLASQLFGSLLLQISPTTTWNIYFIEALILVLLLVCSALISGSEVAFFSFSQKELDACKESEKSQDRIIFRLLSHPKMLLATILLLNNVVNVAIVVISTYVMWQAMGKDSDGWVVLFVTMTITAAIVFFGEVIPKVVARQRMVSFARFMSRPMQFLSSVVRPAAWVLSVLGEHLEKKLHQHKRWEQISVAELNNALALTTENENSYEAQHILKGVINFGQISARQIMTARLDITAAPQNLPYFELLKLIQESGYSRIPIYQENIDHIVGILYAKDLLRHLDEGESFEWQKLIKPQPLFIPESKKISDLFKLFQEKHIHLGIVVDEYGGTSGLITLEDVIEEVVGEIDDEFDSEKEALYSQINENTFLFEAKIPINDFCRTLNLDINHFEKIRGEADSLGGLLLELFAKMPSKGEQIPFYPLIFTIEATDKKRIRKIKVELRP
jgi:putative hemolysin